MLKLLRHKKTAKLIWIILAIIIVPAFVLWGLGGAIRTKEESVSAGKISGKIVSSVEFKDAMEAVRNMAIMQFGDNFSEIQKRMNLEASAWERLVLLQEAKRRKINVGDQEVIDLVQSYPFFQRKGQFNKGIYSQILQYTFRTQPRIFEEQARQNIMLSKLYKEVTSSIKPNEEEIKKQYHKENEEISVYYVASLFADFSKSIQPTDQDLNDYFSKNSLEFKRPLSFNIEYISSDSEDKIKDALRRLKKNKEWELAAKNTNLENKVTGFFTQNDFIPGVGWSAQAMEIISKLKIGEISPILNLEKKYYILRLKERKEPHIPEFAEIKDKIKEAFISNKTRQIAKEKIEACLASLKKAGRKKPASANFTKSAKAFGLKSDSTGLFKYGSYITGVGASDNLWLAAEGLKDKEFSPVIESPTGFFIIRVKSRNPADWKKFQAQKEELTQKFLSGKKEEYFASFLEELKKKAR
ncbi:MAG: SurA N-terminal domain-containing protein [Candidatus Omnitrophica bacterium]|nr:SurA N-terminal domain-containing protein [Candidatus Omnitrophota bacterium]